MFLEMIAAALGVAVLTLIIANYFVRRRDVLAILEQRRRKMTEASAESSESEEPALDR